MDDDLMVAMVKKQWGIDSTQMAVVPLLPLIRFLCQSYRMLGTAQGMVNLMGEAGVKWRADLDRMERNMNCELGEVFK